MSDVNSISWSDIHKSSSDFSFTDTIGQLLVNNEYTEKYKDYLNDPSNSNNIIWNSLSAIGQLIGSTIYENISHYIDNISDIDTCNLKALQSMAEEIGVKCNIYSLFKNAPKEIIDLMNIFSINTEYIYGALSTVIEPVVKSKLRDTVDYNITSTTKTGTVADIEKIYADYDLQTDSAGNTTAVAKEYNVSSNYDKYKDFVYLTFKKLLTDKLNLTYIDDNTTNISFNKVLDNIKAELLDKSSVVNTKLSTIVEYERLNNIPYSFNYEEIVDNIENGTDSLANYNVYQQHILSTEINYRSDYAYKRIPADSTQVSHEIIPDTRAKYAYYKEQDVKKYVNFIQSYNDSSDLNANNIVNLAANYNGSLPGLLPINYNVKPFINLTGNLYDDVVVDKCAKSLANIAFTIQTFRSKLKLAPERYYMRGTFLLLEYVINEYLTELGLWTTATGKPLYNITLKEYYDCTEYFNIETKTTINSKTNDTDGFINAKYFEQLQPHLILLDTIELFYYDTLGMSDIKALSADTTQFKSYNDIATFLSVTYQSGTDDTYIDKYTGKITFNDTSLDNNILTTRKEQYLKYSGRSIGYQPYINIKNQIHSSYQVHPNLYNFTTNRNILGLVKHSFDVSNGQQYQDIVINHLDEYFGNFGNIKTFWKHEIDDLAGYSTAYEMSTNTNMHSSLKNPLIDFDGFAYPPALDMYIANPAECKKSIKERNTKEGTFYQLYYSHLGLTAALASYIASILPSSLPSTYTINKYALDRYGNKVILLNKTVYVRIKDHPIPIKASVLFNNNLTTQQQSYYISFTELNLLNILDNATDIEFNLDLNIISILNNNTATCAIIHKDKDENLVDRYSLIVKQSDHKNKLYQLKSLSGYTVFIGFYKADDYIGIINATSAGNKICLSRYGYVNEYDTILQCDLPPNTAASPVSYCYNQNTVSFIYSTVIGNVHLRNVFLQETQGTLNVNSYNMVDVLIDRYTMKVQPTRYAISHSEFGFIPVYTGHLYVENCEYAKHTDTLFMQCMTEPTVYPSLMGTVPTGRCYEELNSSDIIMHSYEDEGGVDIYGYKYTKNSTKNDEEGFYKKYYTQPYQYSLIIGSCIPTDCSLINIKNTCILHYDSLATDLSVTFSKQNCILENGTTESVYSLYVNYLLFKDIKGMLQSNENPALYILKLPPDAGDIIQVADVNGTSYNKFYIRNLSNADTIHPKFMIKYLGNTL